MECKIVYYVTFNVKKCTKAYEGRTCNPYDYRKYNKYTVPGGKIFRKYKKIISNNCRINDMSKLINSNLLFPINHNEYANLLIKLTEISVSFFDSFSKMSGNHNINILRLVSYSIEGNLPIIQTMLQNELEQICSFDIIQQVKILKLNFIICNQILKRTNDAVKDCTIANVLENLANYLSHLRTICTFIYLIIFKKKSKVVNKLLPTVTYKSSKTYMCALCYQPEEACICFANMETTSNKNYDHDDDHYFSLTVKNLEYEYVPNSWKSVAYAELRK